MPNDTAVRRRGYILVLAATVLWSLAGPLARSIPDLDFGTSLFGRASFGGLCGLLGYRLIQARQAEDFRHEIVEVARQGAVNLTTIDYEHADADVQRILDSSTGAFYDDFKARSGPFADVVKKVKSKSAGTVTEAGLIPDSVSGSEGQVLVAVTVQTTNSGAPDEQPRYWRMRLTVTKAGDQTKVSKVDFVS